MPAMCPAIPRTREGQGSMAKVLIIDDDAATCHALCDMVRGLGHEVVSVLRLTDGLKEVLGRPFDVVFLDVRLPDGSGLDALPTIREAPSSPEVIIITGEGDPDGADLHPVPQASTHPHPCPAEAGLGGEAERRAGGRGSTRGRVPDAARGETERTRRDREALPDGPAGRIRGRRETGLPTVSGLSRTRLYELLKKHGMSMTD